LIRNVYALRTATVRTPRAVFLETWGRGLVDVPILAFALEASQGWYLVDAGMPTSGALLRFGGLGVTRTPEAWSVVEWLKMLGCAPEAIRGVLMTHLDFDHTGALPALRDAPLTVTKREYKEALQPTRRIRGHGRYDPDRICAVRNVRLAEVTHADASSAALSEGAADLFGDGTVLLVSLPGHTAGHAGFLVTLGTGRRLLLCGDAIQTAAQLDGAGLGLMAYAFAHEVSQMRRTVSWLRRLHREDPELTIVPSHDPAIGDRAAEKPLAL
jgi:glyoxylase-like metal-dependent hydrolase (beta-lactamase superfamily II)